MINSRNLIYTNILDLTLIYTNILDLTLNKDLTSYHIGFSIDLRHVDNYTDYVQSSA